MTGRECLNPQGSETEGHNHNIATQKLIKRPIVKPLTDLRDRTKQFHIDVIKLCANLPKNAAGFETARQIIRSAGSVGANYRASKRAKSDADYIYKIGVVIEEADETHYWLEVIKGANLVQDSAALNELLSEANQLTAIFVASSKTARKNRAENSRDDEKLRKNKISQPFRGDEPRSQKNIPPSKGDGSISSSPEHDMQTT
jgi:four helix bundle protein